MGLLPLARNVPGHFGVVYAANIPPLLSLFRWYKSGRCISLYVYSDLRFTSEPELPSFLKLELSFSLFFSHELNGKFEWRVSGSCYINVVECRHRLPSQVQSSKIGNPPLPINPIVPYMHFILPHNLRSSINYLFRWTGRTSHPQTPTPNPSFKLLAFVYHAFMLHALWEPRALKSR